MYGEAEMSEEPRTEVLRRDGITTAEPSFALQSKSSCSFARLLKKGLQLALVELLCQPTADGVLADHSPSSISQNSVKDCDQLAGHGNESEELGFASGDESVAEPFELRFVACRDHGSNEQGTAHALAAAANETLTTPLSGLTGPRCESDKSRNLSTIERAEFRQFGDQGAGDGFSNARHGHQQFLRSDPDG